MNNTLEIRDEGLKLKKSQDNLQTLELLEMAAIEKAKLSFFSATEAAYYIRVILENKLWRWRLEDGNPKYTKQNDYMRELEAKVGWGRSSIFDYLKTMRFGSHLGFTTIEDINALGGVHILRMVKNEVEQAGRINTKGEILEYKNPAKPEDMSPRDFVRSNLMLLTEGDSMRPRDMREEMHRLFSSKPRFEFDLEYIEETGGYDVRWGMTTVDPDTLITEYQGGSLAEGNIPEPVLRLFCKKLFIKWRFSEENEE